TARAARYVGPHPHYLESWGDAEPVNGVVSLRQPTIPRFGDTRPLIESLAAWSTTPTPLAAMKTLGLMASSQGPYIVSGALSPRPAYDLLRDSWAIQVFPRQAKERNFDAFWERAVRDGYVELTPAKTEKAKGFNNAAVKPIKSDTRAKTGLSLVLHPKVGMLDGSHAYNPWLQEFPDPITK